MTFISPIKATTTPTTRTSRGIPSSLLSFCTPSKQMHFEDSDEEEYQNSVVRFRSKKALTPLTERLIFSGGSVDSASSPPNVLELSSQDESMLSIAGTPTKRLGFDKPRTISFEDPEDSSLWLRKLPSFLTVDHLVFPFVLLLLCLISMESAKAFSEKAQGITLNVHPTPQLTQFQSLEEFRKAPVQVKVPPIDVMDGVPDIRSLKFFKLEKGAGGQFLSSFEGTPTTGLMSEAPQDPFESKANRSINRFLSRSQLGIAEVLQDNHVLI